MKFIQRNKGSAINPEGHVNSDYAGDKLNCPSVTGYIFFVADCAFSWHSKQQSMVATSSSHAEYIALFEATQQVLWLNSMDEQFGLTLPDPIDIYCNSQSALAMAKTHRRQDSRGLRMRHKKTTHAFLDFHRG